MKSNILSSESPKVPIWRCSRNVWKVVKFTRYIFLELEKIFRTSIFLNTSEGLLLNIPERASTLLWIFHFSLLYFRDRMSRSSSLQLFFKIGVVKNFAIFTGKYLHGSFFLIKLPAFRVATLPKRDSSTGVFLWILQELFRTAFLYRAPPLAASEFAKSLFTYCLGIHKLCLKTRVASQILSHEPRHKIPVKQLIS